MSLSGSTLDDVFCWVSGGDPEYFYLDDDIAADERRVARAYGISILAVTLIHFICSALSIHEIFVHLRESLSAPIFIGLLVLPLAFLWSALLFSLLRFTIQTGYEHDENWLGRLKRVAMLMPVWLVFPTLGFAAAVPLQTAALSDDIRFAAVVEHWERLGPSLLEVHLSQAVQSDKPHHPCLKPLMTPQIFNDLEDSVERLGACQALVAAPPEAGAQGGLDFDAAYSNRLLDRVRTHLYADGLIARSKHAFRVAPGASWLLALVMMVIFSAPYLTRLLARRRAYEYWRQDNHRRLLARRAHIELHAHDVFDDKGNSVALHRYHGVEQAQREMVERYAKERKQIRQALETSKIEFQQRP
ncbi:MAG: hypothetical protein RL522_1895 [Pseudomonadota bacterium]